MMVLRSYTVPVFGEDCLCHRCKGKGGYKYNASVRRRQLKLAKDSGTDAPPIEYDPCEICAGKGTVPCR